MELTIIRVALGIAYLTYQKWPKFLMCICEDMGGKRVCGLDFLGDRLNQSMQVYPHGSEQV
jgi:hypothetical protein